MSFPISYVNYLLIRLYVSCGEAIEENKYLENWSNLFVGYTFIDVWLVSVFVRESGCGPRYQGGEKFQHRYYGSLHAVQRLELMYKLEYHRGCVNSLHFNRSGELMVSASDDKRVVLWNWAADKTILSYDSGHTGNVFQVLYTKLGLWS